MPRLVQYLSVVLLAMFAVPDALLAQEHCAEGITAAGTCVNPALGRSVRRQTIVRTQSRLSVNSPPVLPSADATAKDPALRGFIRREQSATRP